MELKKTVRLAMLLALSIVLSIIESLIPLFNGMVPGLKLGLANSIVIVVLYLYGFKEAVFISIVRVILVGILRTGLFNITFYFSLVGAIFSVISMYLFSKTSLSIIGVSVVGSFFHSFGQILVASILLRNFNLIYYLPILIICSGVTGIFIGMISKELVKYMKNIL